MRTFFGLVVVLLALVVGVSVASAQMPPLSGGMTPAVFTPVGTGAVAVIYTGTNEYLNAEAGDINGLGLSWWHDRAYTTTLRTASLYVPLLEPADAATSAEFAAIITSTWPMSDKLTTLPYFMVLDEPNEDSTLATTVDYLAELAAGDVFSTWSPALTKPILLNLGQSNGSFTLKDFLDACDADADCVEWLSDDMADIGVHWYGWSVPDFVSYMNDVRSTLDAHGLAESRIWLTEFGWSWPTQDAVNTAMMDLKQAIAQYGYQWRLMGWAWWGVNSDGYQDGSYTFERGSLTDWNPGPPDRELTDLGVMYPLWDSGIQYAESDASATTSSGTYGVLAGTYVTVTVPWPNASVVIDYSVWSYNNGTSGFTLFQVFEGDTEQAVEYSVQRSAAANVGNMTANEVVIHNVAPGVHGYHLRWKVTGGTATAGVRGITAYAVPRDLPENVFGGYSLNASRAGG